MRGPSDRGQAFTLESLIAALLLVTAVLLALQSVVILPSSAGTLDRDVQAQLHQESSDNLMAAENDRELSRMVRYWNTTDGAFADDPDPDGAGDYVQDNGYQRDQVPIQDFGEALNHTVREGNQYNVVLAYETASGDRETTRLVYQGAPGDDVLTASYTVTLTDDQFVTGPDSEHTRIGDVSNPPIPDRNPSSPIYNVVEVRLVLW